jgi:hypothetical protein
MGKITKHLRQDNQSPGRNVNPGPPEYEAGLLITRSRRSVGWWLTSFLDITQIKPYVMSQKRPTVQNIRA